jgi:hypothetical protein
LVLTITAVPLEPLASEVDEYGLDDVELVCAAAGVAELVLEVLAVLLLLPQALSATAAERAAVTARCFATSTPVVRSGWLSATYRRTDAPAATTFPAADSHQFGPAQRAASA